MTSQARVAASIALLPVEVLAPILIMALYMRFRAARIALSSTCTLWCAIIVQDPASWAVFHFNTWTSPDPTLLLAVLLRSPDAALHIALDVDAGTDFVDPYTRAAILQQDTAMKAKHTLSPHLCRIVSLHMRLIRGAPRGYWPTPFHNSGMMFPRLETLTVSSDSKTSDDPLYQLHLRTPALRTLALKGTSPRDWDTLVGAMLTEMTLHPPMQVELEPFVRMLARCSGLQRLSLVSVRVCDGVDEATTWEDEQPQLPVLRHVTLIDGSPVLRVLLPMHRVVSLTRGCLNCCPRS